MDVHSLYIVLGLLAVGLVTPGPNNITCIVHSSVHGPRANISLISGMALGFFIVHLISGYVVMHIDPNHPGKIALEIMGLLFLMLVALKVFTLQPWATQNHIDQELQTYSNLFNTTTIPRLGFKTGVMMQFLNGKEWTLVGAVMLQALDGFGGGLNGVLSIASITITGGLIAMTLWTLVGSKMVALAEDEKKGTLMFRTLGGLMFLLLAGLMLKSMAVLY
jgi:threonine/homoserine/homoserine lactone efflux protein